MKKRFLALFLCLVLALLCAMTACGETSTPGANSVDTTAETDKNTEQSNPTVEGKNTNTNANPFHKDTNPVVDIHFNTGDMIQVELYPDYAPISVSNFLRYVEEGFYVGTCIHRMAIYVVQGGGYTFNESLGFQKKAAHDAITGEFASNGIDNPVPHTAGAISMARMGENPEYNITAEMANNSATSEFFFCPIDMSSYWDGSYAAFGHVVSDADLRVVQKIATMNVEDSESPAYLVYITATSVVK